jgi:hypothetical protein
MENVLDFFKVVSYKIGAIKREKEKIRKRIKGRAKQNRFANKEEAKQLEGYELELKKIQPIYDKLDTAVRNHEGEKYDQLDIVSREFVEQLSKEDVNNVKIIISDQIKDPIKRKQIQSFFDLMVSNSKARNATTDIKIDEPENIREFAQIQNMLPPAGQNEAYQVVAIKQSNTRNATNMIKTMIDAEMALVNQTKKLVLEGERYNPFVNQITGEMIARGIKIDEPSARPVGNIQPIPLIKYDMSENLRGYEKKIANVRAEQRNLELKGPDAVTALQKKYMVNMGINRSVPVSILPDLSFKPSLNLKDIYGPSRPISTKGSEQQFLKDIEKVMNEKRIIAEVENRLTEEKFNEELSKPSRSLQGTYSPEFMQYIGKLNARDPSIQLTQPEQEMFGTTAPEISDTPGFLPINLKLSLDSEGKPLFPVEMPGVKLPRKPRKKAKKGEPKQSKKVNKELVKKLRSLCKIVKRVKK